MGKSYFDNMPAVDKAALKTSLGLDSKLKGKKLEVIGDSITWYDGHNYPDTTLCIGYPTLVKNKLGIDTLINDGINGASMAQSPSYPTNGSMAVVISTGSNTFAGVDIVTILAGTNDYKLNVPIGTIGAIGDAYASFDLTTFYGGYRKVIECILIRNKNVRLVLMTPIQRDVAANEVEIANTAGHKLIDYANAIKALGQKYGIPVLDLYSVSNITKLTKDIYLFDSLHPNNIGHARIADLLSRFLENT